MVTVGNKVKVEKGCRARGVVKGASARVTSVEQLGGDYSHQVKVTLFFLNTTLCGRTLTFYARHTNRLADPVINLNDGRPEHLIQVRKVEVPHVNL